MSTQERGRNLRRQNIVLPKDFHSEISQSCPQDYLALYRKYPRRSQALEKATLIYVYKTPVSPNQIRTYTQPIFHGKCHSFLLSRPRENARWDGLFA